MTRQHVKEIAEASSAGPLNWGETSKESIEKLAPEEGAELWTTWAGEPDDSLIVAVTGNGPTSRANARFFSVARSHVLELCEQLGRKERGARELMAGLVAFREDLLSYDASEDHDGRIWDGKRIELDRTLQEAIKAAEQLGAES